MLRLLDMKSLKTGPCSSWLRTLLSPKPNGFCAETQRIITADLAQCESSHPKCQVNDPFLPTRLLDLGIGDSELSMVRLVVTRDLALPRETIKYTALSYCWGPSKLATTQLKTEKNSIQSRLSGFSVADCSEVMKDAIAVARRLSLRFLWIDSLCIIQDDIHDWTSESMVMGQIYQHAFLTIAALASDSCTRGFLKREDIWRNTIRIHFQSSLRPEIEGSYFIRWVGINAGTPHSTYAHDLPMSWDLNDASWSARGWTFQEHYMSTRVLIFGKFRTYLVCHGQHQSENRERFGPSLLGVAATSSIAKWEPLVALDYWQRAILPLYLKRNFTDNRDKLPAISSLARTFSTRISQNYAAGMWTGPSFYKHLFRLAIRTNFTSRERLLSSADKPVHFIGPSWSPIGHPESDDIYGCFGGDEQPFDFQQESEITNVWTSPSGPDQFGRIDDGQLEIVGKLLSLSDMDELVYSGIKNSRYSQINIFHVKSNGDTVATAFLDWFSGFMNTLPTNEWKDLYLIPLGSFLCVSKFCCPAGAIQYIFGDLANKDDVSEEEGFSVSINELLKATVDESMIILTILAKNRRWKVLAKLYLTAVIRHLHKLGDLLICLHAVWSNDTLMSVKDTIQVHERVNEMKCQPHPPELAQENRTHHSGSDEESNDIRLHEDSQAPDMVEVERDSSNTQFPDTASNSAEGQHCGDSFLEDIRQMILHCATVHADMKAIEWVQQIYYSAIRTGYLELAKYCQGVHLDRTKVHVEDLANECFCAERIGEVHFEDEGDEGDEVDEEDSNRRCQKKACKTCQNIQKDRLKHMRLRSYHVPHNIDRSTFKNLFGLILRESERQTGKFIRVGAFISLSNGTKESRAGWNLFQTQPMERLVII